MPAPSAFEMAIFSAIIYKITGPIRWRPKMRLRISRESSTNEGMPTSEMAATLRCEHASSSRLSKPDGAARMRPRIKNATSHLLRIEASISWRPSVLIKGSLSQLKDQNNVQLSRRGLRSSKPKIHLDCPKAACLRFGGGYKAPQDRRHREPERRKKFPP